MRFNPKINKKNAFFALLLLNSGAIGSFVADQKNVSKVEMPMVDDPCNFGGSIYVSCQDATKGLPTPEFISCMEKLDTYSDRDGDKCCPDPDPAKQFYDCEPTPPPTPSSGGGMTLAQKLGLSAGIIGLAACVAVAVKKGVTELQRRQLVVPRVRDAGGLQRAPLLAEGDAPVGDGNARQNLA